MKPSIQASAAALAAIFALSATSVSAQEDTTFVRLADGTVDALPAALVSQRTQTATQVVFTDISGQQHTYSRSNIVSESSTRPAGNPTFTSFKFNNKYNPQVFVDVELDPTQGRQLSATVAGIGKWLTPSFQVSSEDASVYVGNELQRSKRSRRSFATDQTYTVALAGRRVLRRFVDVQGVVGEDPVDELEKIDLDISNISTNAPSNKEGEGLESLIDDDPSTFFHSTWGDEGPYEKLPLDSCPWIEVTLPASIRYVSFSYATRHDTNQRSPLELELQTSINGTTWTSVRTFTAEQDGLPIAAGASWTAPTMELPGLRRRFRVVLRLANYKNYLCMSELSFYKVTPGTGVTPQEEQSHCEMVPYGTDYNIHIDFPTDQATQVPRIDLNLADGYEMIFTKDYYIDATFSIDGAGVFPDMEATPVQVKGRGNSSWDGNVGWWGNNPKNPYRLKFGEKVKPFGLTKGKSWVLLANKISGSMTTNAIGMRAACMVGTEGCNHIVPVELYINGSYRGSYNFTEKVGFSNNSIDLDDESAAALLELDSYFDEDYKFRTTRYRLPVNVKEPDFSEEGSTTLTLDDIKNDFDELVSRIYDGEDVSDRLDLDAFAKFYMVNDLILNQELFHPKSTYLYRADFNDPESRYMFGPVWDLDWAFGHEMNSGYFTTAATFNYLTAKSMEVNSFWRQIIRSGESVERTLYAVWFRFMERGGLEELLDFCDEYYAYARPSFQHNAQLWGDGNNYASTTSNAKTWLKQRAQYVYSQLTPYPDIVDAIDNLEAEPDADGSVAPSRTSVATVFDVYNINGLRVRAKANASNWRNGLPGGLYIINGRKVLIP